MIFGKLTPHATQLETKNDFYDMASISVISVRRPFLSAGLMISAVTAAFGAGFWDLLYDGERITIIAVAATSVALGWSIGLVQLVSRDLRGLPLSDAVYGTYPELRRRVAEVAGVIADAKRGDRVPSGVAS